MTISSRDRILLAIVVALGLMGAYYVLALKPERQRAASLSSQIASQRQALTTAQAELASGRAAKASLAQDAAEWAALRRAVPSQSDIPGLLRTLQANANAVHVQLQSISLSSSGSSSAASTPSVMTPNPAATAAGATSIPLQLSFVGGYAALDRLVRRLDAMVVMQGNKVQSSGPLLTISDVSLSPQSNSSSSGGSGSSGLTVQLTATIYQLNTAPSAASSTTGGPS